MLRPLARALAIALLASACAPAPPPQVPAPPPEPTALSGTSDGVAWRAEDLSVEHRTVPFPGAADPGQQTVWHYRIVLTELIGRQVAFSRALTTYVPDYPANIDKKSQSVSFTLPPKKAVRANLSVTVVMPASWRGELTGTSLTIFEGVDDAGAPVRVVLRYRPELIPPEPSR